MSDAPEREEVLRPCPFCKGAASLYQPILEDPRVVCDNGSVCDCNGPSKPTAEQAIAAWNRRAETAEPVAVKALSWPDECKRGRRVNNDATKSLVVYEIAHYGGTYGRPTDETVYRWAGPQNGWSEPFHTYDGAKAAAQADYETRIRSALAASPQEPSYHEPVTPAQLYSRDKFIVEKGLWDEFTKQLATAPASPQEPVAWQRRYWSEPDQEWSGWELISQGFYNTMGSDTASYPTDRYERRQLYATPASPQEPVRQALIAARAVLAEYPHAHIQTRVLGYYNRTDEAITRIDDALAATPASPAAPETDGWLRKLEVNLNHALMVLDMPASGHGKRAWASLIEARDAVEAALAAPVSSASQASTNEGETR